MFLANGLGRKDYPLFLIFYSREIGISLKGDKPRFAAKA